MFKSIALAIQIVLTCKSISKVFCDDWDDIDSWVVGQVAVGALGVHVFEMPLDRYVRYSKVGTFQGPWLMILNWPFSKPGDILGDTPFFNSVQLRQAITCDVLFQIITANVVPYCVLDYSRSLILQLDHSRDDHDI